MGLKAAPYESLEQQVQDASVIIVATNASSPVIAHQQLINSTPKILIDLSIPNNIEPAAGTLAHITLANVDDLSKINDETLLKRKAEVPKALTIIETHKAEFEEWLSLRSHVPVLKAVKQKLEARFPDRKLIIGRSANLTAKLPGRGTCQYRNLCHRGCPFGAYFSTLSATLPAAEKAKGVSWPIGCFNRPWLGDKNNPWGYDTALDGIKAAGYKLTGMLTRTAKEPFIGSDATPEYLAEKLSNPAPAEDRPGEDQARD